MANPDSFKVENGAIVANAVGQPSHLFYDGPVGNHSFQDFDLRLDVVARYRSNGVYVMTEFRPQGFPGKGFEIQVNNSHSDRIRTASITSSICRTSRAKTTNGCRWKSRVRETRP